MLLLPGLDVVGRGRVAVRGAAVQQLLQRLPVALGALVLAHRPLVPVQLEPAQRVEDLLDVLGRRALAVGVLDPQHQLAPLVAGLEPVVQCRPRSADVERPRRRRGEPHLYWRFLC